MERYQRDKNTQTQRWLDFSEHSSLVPTGLEIN
jgi:hypothetical protein